jgi:hypothetical protein
MLISQLTACDPRVLSNASVSVQLMDEPGAWIGKAQRQIWTKVLFAPSNLGSRLIPKAHPCSVSTGIGDGPLRELLDAFKPLFSPNEPGALPSGESVYGGLLTRSMPLFRRLEHQV